MTETLQLESDVAVELHDAPKLLVEWPPRWQDFVTSIGPAFSRSGPRLAGEAPHGVLPYRELLGALLAEAFLFFVVMILPGKVANLRPYATPRVRPDEVIYYSGDELPRTEDLGGTHAGATGRAGGREAHHRTQTIHVARGASRVPRVVDAPDVKLPSSSGAVANFLAFKSNPAPRPTEGLHSSLVAPRLPSNVIAPAATNIAHDQRRNRVSLDAVVPPAPNVSRDQSRSAPSLNAAIVAPAPNVRSEHTLIAPSLGPSIIAPAPNVSQDRRPSAPSLDPNVIGPASTKISHDRSRSAPDLNASVIPPAPSASREVSPSGVQMNNAQVVPPPVSAPERDSSRNAKLNLPAPSVIAPPPSADSTRDLHRLESGSSRAATPNVIAPPPTQAPNGSIVSSIIGKLFGTQDAVAPPPTVSSATSRSANGGQGTSLTNNVVPPPPSVGNSAGAGSPGTGRSRGSSLGANVIAPPPSVAGSSRGSSSGDANSAGADRGTQLANNVVAPPPSVSSGSGRKGTGFGGPGDVGSALAPPKGENGTKGSAGIVISDEPGDKVGLPGSGGKGSLAMSPTGGDQPGLGGSGGGSGIGRGDHPGSGLTGEGSGATKSGAGHGSDPNARAGISPTPGPGGAGTAPTGSPAVPGVDVRGGSTTVTLPSFAEEGGSEPTVPGRSSVKQQQGPAITIVATSRSGGAFDFYGKLPGDNYTVYVDTPIGTVVMQFAEADPTPHSGTGALIGPQGIRTNLPADLPHARVVIKCKLDASGNLKNFQVLEPGPAAMTAKIMAALPSWKFRPATRGAQPVEVNAILGFNIDTNDRY
jgi:hypothetical protein